MESLLEEKRTKFIKATGDPTNELTQQLLIDQQAIYAMMEKWGGDPVKRPLVVNIPGTVVTSQHRHLRHLACPSRLY